MYGYERTRPRRTPRPLAGTLHWVVPPFVSHVAVSVYTRTAPLHRLAPLRRAQTSRDTLAVVQLKVNTSLLRVFYGLRRSGSAPGRAPRRGPVRDIKYIRVAVDGIFPRGLISRRLPRSYRVYNCRADIPDGRVCKRHTSSIC